MSCKNKLPRRILIIGHSPFDHPYGASTSIREHYIAIGDENIEFIHISRTKSYGHFSRYINENKNINHIKYPKDILISPLPDSANWIFYEKKNSIFLDKKKVLRDLFWIFRAKGVLKKIVDLQPDIVHLNSLVLSKLIHPLKKYLPNTLIVSHARELLLPLLSEKERLRITALDGIVAIDSAVKKSIEVAVPMFSKEKIHIIQNPFRSSTKLLDAELKSILPFDNETVLFSILGSISHPKGVGTVCEAFDKANLVNSELIIFGEIADNYGAKLKKRWTTNSRIRWVGHHAYLLERGLFNKIDCVVRGESYFCTGRTVYEMLFSGGSVIVPGSGTDLLKDQNLKKFENNVHFYEPRNVEKLADTFKSVKNKIQLKQEREIVEKSNYSEYKRKMLDVYNINS